MYTVRAIGYRLDDFKILMSEFMLVTECAPRCWHEFDHIGSLARSLSAARLNLLGLYCQVTLSHAAVFIVSSLPDKSRCMS